MTNELTLLEYISSFLDKEHTIIFDMTRTNKHWLLDYKYFFVRKNISKNTINTDTCLYGHFYDTEYPEVDINPYFFLQAVFENYIKMNWRDKLSIGRIELLAWSKYTVEKDTGLFYLYDLEDNYKGIFCNCTNRGDECIYVGQSINDFFDLELTLQEIVNGNPGEDFAAHKKILSKNQLLTYDKLLKKEQFKILDSELGFQVDLRLYEKLILEIFIPLSNNNLRLSKLELIDNEDNLKFLWHVENKSFEIQVENKSDYIDLNIYKSMNEILGFFSIENKFVLFRDFDFGQEYGLAYLDSKMTTKLGKLIRVDLIEL